MNESEMRRLLVWREVDQIGPDALESIPDAILRAARDEARSHGCTCNPKVYLIFPSPDLAGMKFEHQPGCQGLREFRGQQGVN